VRYWDSSAVVALIEDEPGTDLVASWLREDPGIVTWALTTTEVAAAIERRAREGVLTSADRRRALRLLERLGASWDEVIDVLGVRRRALGVLARHALRAADACQLGAAWLAAEGQPETLPVVTLDRRLAIAAEREGFPVLTWPEG
jgi:predicted nucleic acid-binding protein